MTDDSNQPPKLPDEPGKSYRQRVSKAIGKIAWLMEKELLSKGEIAELRRLNSTSSHGRGSAFWRIVVNDLEENELLRGDVEQKLRCWSTILQGLATVAELHQPKLTLGKAMADAEISEPRLTRLLRARGDGLHSLIRPLAHQLRSRAQPVNWGDVAWLLLSEGGAGSERCRQRVASDYYRSEYKKTQAEPATDLEGSHHA